MRSLTPRGPFDSLIFYYDLTLSTKIFFYFGGRGMVGGVPLFGSLNLTKFIYIVVLVYT